jgi:hypothetical protein
MNFWPIQLCVFIDFGLEKIKKIFGSSNIKNGRSIQDARQNLIYFFLKNSRWRPYSIWRFFLAYFSRSSRIRQQLQNAKVYAYSLRTNSKFAAKQ